jgi:hypothetical protein
VPCSGKIRATPTDARGAKSPWGVASVVTLARTAPRPPNGDGARQRFEGIALLRVLLSAPPAENVGRLHEIVLRPAAERFDLPRLPVEAMTGPNRARLDDVGVRLVEDHNMVDLVE